MVVEFGRTSGGGGSDPRSKITLSRTSNAPVIATLAADPAVTQPPLATGTEMPESQTRA